MNKNEQFSDIPAVGDNLKRERRKQHLTLDALALAEAAGSSKAVNIVLMGHLSRYFDFTEEEWLEALEQSVAPKFLEMNRKAFAMGRNA